MSTQHVQKLVKILDDKGKLIYCPSDDNILEHGTIFNC